MIIDELVAVLGYDLRGEANLARYQAGIKRAESSLTAFAAAAARVGAVVGAAVGAGMAYVGKSVIATSAEFESYQATLETLEGSSEKARASLDWITQFAKTTPYDVAQVTEAFVRMRAYGLEPANGSLRAIGDVASAMGKTLMQGVEAIADATTGEFERLKEFGVRASVAGDQVTFSWVENGKTITKTVRKSGDEISNFLVGNFGRFQGAMDKQSKTWRGLVSNLGDTWTQFLLRIGRGGFFDTVKGKLDSFLSYVDRLDQDGTLDRWSKNLSNAFTKAVNVVERGVDRLLKVGGAIASVFDSNSALAGLGAVAGALLIRLFPVASGIIFLALALEDLWTALEGGDSVIGNFIKQHPQLEAALEGVKEFGKALVDFLGPLSGYVGPALASAAAIGLLAPAIRALGTAMLVLTGVKPAWQLIAFLAGLTGVSKGAGSITAMGVAIRGLGVAITGLAAIAGAIAWFGPGVAEKKREVKPGEPGDWIKRLTGTDITEDREERLDRINGEKIKYQGGPSRRGRDRGDVERQSSLDGFVGTTDRSARAAANNADGGGSIAAMLQNMNGNLAKMSADALAAKVDATITDARQDNRQFPVTVNAPTTVNVQQATQAPAAAGAAVGRAVGQAATQQATRIASTPSQL